MSTDLTISLAAVFVSDPDDHPLKLVNQWAQGIRGLTSLSLITELAEEGRGYIGRFKSYLQSIEAPNASDPMVYMSTTESAEKTRETILKRCFTEQDAEELFDLCRDANTLRYMRDLEKIVDPAEKDETVESFKTVAREFFVEIPQWRNSELPEEASLTWDTVLAKVRHARGPLNDLRILQTLGADGKEVASNLRRATTDLDELFPESWAVSHGSDGGDSDIQ
ncbi:hypothetical protein JCM24511_06472 [Saitozyma sp. JCM 24511]|nr:hypothetical protein JCM24511_06472 [Saitozyma sp. JCM 24511]